MITYDPLEGAWEIPEKIKKWGEQCSPPLENPCLAHISFYRTPDEVISIGRLLLPEFIEYEHGVFLKAQFNKERFFQWSKKLQDISAVEKMLNHIHIYDVFGHADNVSEKEYMQIAKLLQKSWEISLAITLPNYEFEVTLQNSEQDYGPVVSFYKLR